MANKNKIGVGLITCDRPNFYQKAIDSLLKAKKDVDIEYIVIDDGKEKLPIYPENYQQTEGYNGVAVAKNLAFKFLIDRSCEHIFLMEDDIEILDKNIFDLYINAQKATGIKHFNFGLHGNHNLDYLGRPNTRKTINYPNNTRINLYPNVLGAFSYYHIDVLNDVGLMDERFYNALEHVDHTYQAIVKGYHPPFRWFADVETSRTYLKDIVPDHQQSKIRSENNFQETFQKGLDLFIEKNKFSVVSGYGPQETMYSEKETLEKLKDIWKFHREPSE